MGIDEIEKLSGSFYSGILLVLVHPHPIVLKERKGYS